MTKRLREMTKWIPKDMLEDFEERAGIMEFDGGLRRADAEREAAKIVLKQARARRVLRP